jgi:hypothetical protein
MCVLGMETHECKSCPPHSAPCHHEPNCNDDPCEVAKNTINFSGTQITEHQVPHLIPAFFTLIAFVLTDTASRALSTPHLSFTEARPLAAYPASSFPLLV